MGAMTLELDDGFYVSPGDLVAGKYLVERVLGSGGMAFVLEARHVELDQHFALKFLDERFLGNARIIERFTQEAKAACKIRSEHVARVYDVGVHDGAPFFVMEHLEGRDLCAVVRDNGPLRMDDAVEFVMQACEALAVAHCHGIVHRDIKPENLFLVERAGLPLVKVLDFGISKVSLTGGAPVSRLTGELTMGTPCYMSPEQIRSTASADARSDQWSLGVVLYELLAGTEAFRADSVSAVCAAVLEREPPPLGELRPDLPAELTAVVMRCLEKDPARRFADVAELAHALLPFAPSRALVSAERSSSVMKAAHRPDGEKHVSLVRPTSLVPRHVSEAPISQSPLSASPVAASIEPARPHSRSGFAYLALGLGIVIVGLLGYGAHWRNHHEPVVAAAPPAAPPPPAVEPEPVAVPTAIRVVAPVASEEKPKEAPRRVAPIAQPPAQLRAAASVLPPDVRSAKRAEPQGSAGAPSVELGY